MKKILLLILSVLYQILILPYILYKAIEMYNDGLNPDSMKEMEKRMRFIFEILKQDGWIEPEVSLMFDTTDTTCYYFSEIPEQEYININFAELFLKKEKLRNAPHILNFLNNLYLESFFHEIGHYIDRANQDLEDYQDFAISDAVTQMFFRDLYEPDDITAQKHYQELPSEKIAFYYGLDIYNYLKDVLNENLFNYLFAPFQKS